MRRVLAVLLAGATVASALGAWLAVRTEPTSAFAPLEVSQSGPHLMQPNPDAYPRAPFVQDPRWTGTPPGTRGTGQTPTATGPQSVLVILIDFTDEPQSVSSAQILDRMNDVTPGAGSVRNFYTETSWGQLTMTGTVYGWYRSSYPMSEYGADSPSGSYDDRNGPIYRLVVEAVRAADADVDFSQYDVDPRDGVVDHLIVVHAGAAQEESGTNPNLIWSHRWSVVDAEPGAGNQPLRADNVQIYGYIMVSESSPIGVYVHELGHDFGLPDLYDTDGSSDGVGKWDVMGTGSWNALATQSRGTMPAHFGAWSKIKLGWVQPATVSSPLFSQVLDQMGTRTPTNGIPVPYKLPVRSNGAEEYFLVENRQPVGFDRGLPGAGLLIWHIDESVPGNADDAHRLVDLEEADGSDTPTQSTDPWEDTIDGFGPDSTPNSNSYLNQRTGWKVRNISPSGSEMTADLSHEVDDDLVILAVRHAPWAVQTGSSVSVTVTVANRGARLQSGFAVNLTVYRDTYAPASVLCCAEQTAGSLVRGATQNLTWTVPAPLAGKYILEASAALALDEIPENNFMFAHFNAGSFALLDDVEGGDLGWSRNGDPGDPARWEIVQDDNASQSHSPSHAWKFGRKEASLPCVPPLCPPEFHTLTYGPVTVTGSLYVYVWQRYDLRGRAELNTSVETDTAYVNVSIDGNWRTLRNGTLQGVGSDWHIVYEDLSQYLDPAGSQVVVELSASSNVITDEGGWWVDDIAISRTPLRGGLVARAVNPTEVVEPGGVVFFRFKVANVGDWDDDVRFNITGLPDGWIAAIGQNQSRMEPYYLFETRLRADAEATLFLGFQVAVDAPRGVRHTVTVIVASVTDTSVSTTFDTVTIINDPWGLAGLEKYVFLFLIVFAAIIVIAVVIDAIKKQRGVYRRW